MPVWLSVHTSTRNLAKNTPCIISPGPPAVLVGQAPLGKPIEAPAREALAVIADAVRGVVDQQQHVARAAVARGVRRLDEAQHGERARDQATRHQGFGLGTSDGKTLDGNSRSF